jgi:hypothetical protein
MWVVAGPGIETGEGLSGSAGLGVWLSPGGREVGDDILFGLAFAIFHISHMGGVIHVSCLGLFNIGHMSSH